MTERYPMYYVQKPPRRRIACGDRVRVCDCSGTQSGQEGTVIPKRNVPTNGSGVPQVDGGHYKPMGPDEVAYRLDNGRIDTMFANRLILVTPID